MSDAQFVEQARTGHDGAYEELVRRWAPRVVAFCRSRVRLEDVAEDLAQEAMIRGHRLIRSLREPAKFGAWVIGIADLVCRMISAQLVTPSANAGRTMWRIPETGSSNGLT